MIKTSVYGYPIFTTSDNTYSMPSYTGAVQWNGINRKFQVSNGSSWIDVDNNVNFTVDAKLAEIIDWASKKIEFEKKIETLSLQYSAVKDAKEKLDILLALVEADNK